MPSSRALSAETVELVGQEITVSGWVHSIRNHGKVLFIDLRDRSGLLQIVTGPWAPDSVEVLQSVSPEWVIEVTGTVAARPENLVNPHMVSGTVELQASRATVLNRCPVPPFEISGNTAEVEEELRLRYRYLDLRTARLQKNIRHRAAVVRFFRQYLDERGFTEVETPLLTASTPEGARDYVVPTRKKGQFFALPQSPQQYKQLLMVAGFERYYQIAKCLRDEDNRLDRQPEFTQLDMEMSFATQDDILSLTEAMYTAMLSTLYPEKYITAQPWPRLTYAEVMDQYGTDKPDLRKDKNDPHELAFCWVVDFPLFEYNDKEKRIEPMHHMFTMPKPEHLPLLDSDPLKVIGQQYDLVCNGYENASGSIRIIDQAVQEKVFSLIGITPEEARHKFGHMLEAFQYGAPPHGGIAPGLDRLCMILENEPNIREVIAFPKTGEGRDPMMGAPAPISPAQLAELGLTVQSEAPEKKTSG
jgi:aspartyl-tRNA synthetase